MNNAANDDQPRKTITVSELAAALQIDEDALLRRIAGTIAKRSDRPEPEPAIP